MGMYEAVGEITDEMREHAEANYGPVRSVLADELSGIEALMGVDTETVAFREAVDEAVLSLTSTFVPLTEDEQEEIGRDPEVVKRALEEWRAGLVGDLDAVDNALARFGYTPHDNVVRVTLGFLFGLTSAAMDGAVSSMYAIASGEDDEGDLDATWDMWREARQQRMEVMEMLEHAAPGVMQVMIG
ncbi:hypothetical protein KIH27_15880 [Mycobacterium sp. M1]|uniref:Uncharacterized protein n=1 Tax=Mycolicibacter acidiphilus TaxID=2835306 RepID=A0ABS5RL79_9MYCO|nr:hypothetical protein [Mycolicibacter acidiphilus]MBS9535067.1 hypothetical protein [Mycolicibacter acidiphilus]